MVENRAPKRAVYTIMLGGYEELLPQPALRDTNIDAFCLTDDPELVSEDWKIVNVPRRFSGDIVRSQRLLKVRFSEYFEEYDETLYIDNTVQLKTTPEIILDEWLRESDMTLIEHSFRERLIDEFDEVVRMNYDDAIRVHEQLWHYGLHMPEVLDGKPLWTGMMARRNVPEVVAAMDLWYEHILRYSRRDQLSVLTAFEDRKFRLRTLVRENAESEWHTWKLGSSRRISQGKRPPLPDGPLLADLLRMTDRLDTAIAENERLLKRAEKFEEELEGVRESLVGKEALEQEVRVLSETLLAVQHSTSWRITAPVRRLVKSLKRSGLGSKQDLS